MLGPSCVLDSSHSALLLLMNRGGVRSLMFPLHALHLSNLSWNTTDDTLRQVRSMIYGSIGSCKKLLIRVLLHSPC